MKMEMDTQTDYWSIFFGIISLIFANLAIFIPTQRIMLSAFTIFSIVFAMLIYYINKINSNEEKLDTIKREIVDFSNKVSEELTEKFNYLKEIYNLKIDVEMLKKKNKKAEIELMDLIKIIVAAILIYVLVQVVKSLFAG